MGGKALEGEFALLANLPSEQNGRKSDSCAAGKGSEGTGANSLMRLTSRACGHLSSVS